MKYLLSLSLLLISFGTYAQEDLTIPLLEVEGISIRKVAPDEAVFSIALEEKSMKVPAAVEVLNQKTKNLANALNKAKIKDYKLIADNYSVNINRVYIKGNARDSGYVARQSLRIVTGSKDEDLQKIVEAIQNSGDMSFNLHFQVSEATKNSLQDALLVEALKNAESKARLIAQTLGIKNIRVHRVNITSDGPSFPKMEMMRTSADASTDVLISPDQQSITRQVSVKYTY